MVQTVVWTKRAELSFHEIVDFLLFKWNEKVAAQFALLAEKKIHMLQHYPRMGILSRKTGFRKVLSHENVELYYEYRPENEQIEIHLF